MRPATAATTTWPGQQQLLLSRFHANNTQPQKYFHWYSLVLELPHERLWGGGEGVRTRGCSRWQLQLQLMLQVLLARTLHLSLPFGPFRCQISAWCGASRQPRTISDIAGCCSMGLWFMGYTLTGKPIGLHKKCDLIGANLNYNYVLLYHNHSKKR